MAKKPTPAINPVTPKAAAPKIAARGAGPDTAAKATSASPMSTPVRNSAVPKPQAAGPKPAITPEQIAKKAYEIWQSGTGGSEHDNWVRAERELRGL